ncbi:RNA polymerase sigma factor [Ruminococcus flavefaciens]|uniref:RNA polymerase sigma factor n=1 Tax=Ruminococcus flavefaciens TaxID=1265 RepID=UPI0026ED3A58|nr:RNA polymerase sigma factor [Ruminococcus flavefaciens]MDD7518122.1 RNA polymerase sigma factor [Ruminococcus flavefaciens]MDY5691395.1 RNA polymerase sigma factor [Ruminococcus flavefaciens]
MEILLDKQACRKEDGISLFGKRTDARHGVFLLINDIIAQNGCLSVLEKLFEATVSDRVRSDSGARNYDRFINGDNDGMTEIIREYKDGLSLYINSMVRNICEAEELMEETFVELVMKKPKYSGKSTFKTWLYAIGRNITYDYIKKRSKSYELPIDELYDVSDEENLEKTYIQREENIALYKALSSVNTDYGQALHLVYIEGLSIKEAAEVMKKTKKQVENLVCRGKKAMRSQLEKEGFVYEGLYSGK